MRKLLSTKSDVTTPQTIDEVEQAMESVLADKTTFLSRTVAAVEVQLSAEVNPYLDDVLESLDRRWRARVAAKADLK